MSPTFTLFIGLMYDTGANGIVSNEIPSTGDQLILAHSTVMTSGAVLLISLLHGG